MAKRSEVLGALQGVGTGFSKMGQMMMERERFDTQKALEEEENERKRALAPHVQTAAEANAGTAKLGLSEALVAADKRKGLDAFNQERIAQNMAAGWKVDPDDEGRVEELKARLAVLNRWQAANNKPITTPEEFYQEEKDKKFDRTAKTADETRKGERHGSDMETDKSQRKLLGAQAEKAAADAQAAGLPNSGKPPTADQAKVATFGRRVEQAMAEMGRLEEGGYDRSSPKAGLGAKLPNVLKSSSAQQQAQAERNFVNAVLRRESGAVISDQEFANAEKQYFPRTGDSPETLEQKARNRQQVVQGFQAEAGPAWERVAPVAAPGAKPAAPAAGGLDRADPKVKAALAAGYTEDEIRAHLGKGR